MADLFDRIDQALSGRKARPKRLHLPESGHDVPVSRSAAPSKTGPGGPDQVAATFTGSGRDDTDNQATVATGLPVVVARPYTFDGTTWDRARSVESAKATGGGGVPAAGILGFRASDSSYRTPYLDVQSADAIGATTNFGLFTNGFGYGFNGTTWDRLRTAAIGDTVAHTGLPAAGLFGFSGATWSRLRAGATNADDEAAETLGALVTKGRNYAWDGAAWDRLRQPTQPTDTQPVSAASLPLPSGASTSALQYVQRPSEKTGRTYVTADLAVQTADALLYTVTNGKVLYVTSIQLAAFNTSTSANGDLALKDGTTAAGTRLTGWLMTPAGIAAQLAASAAVGFSTTFPEPLKFTTGMFLDIVVGTVTYSVSFVGYEE